MSNDVYAGTVQYNLIYIMEIPDDDRETSLAPSEYQKLAELEQDALDALADTKDEAAGIVAGAEADTEADAASIRRYAEMDAVKSVTDAGMAVMEIGGQAMTVLAQAEAGVMAKAGQAVKDAQEAAVAIQAQAEIDAAAIRKKAEDEAAKARTQAETDAKATREQAEKDAKEAADALRARENAVRQREEQAVAKKMSLDDEVMEIYLKQQGLQSRTKFIQRWEDSVIAQGAIGIVQRADAEDGIVTTVEKR